MKKVAVMIVVLFTAITASFGQWKVQKVTEYIVNDVELKVGDFIITGNPSDGSVFVYYTMDATLAAMSGDYSKQELGANQAGVPVKIKKIKVMTHKKTGYTKVTMSVGGGNMVNYIFSDVKKAIDSGELTAETMPATS